MIINKIVVYSYLNKTDMLLNHCLVFFNFFHTNLYHFYRRKVKIGGKRSFRTHKNTKIDIFLIFNEG